MFEVASHPTPPRTDELPRSMTPPTQRPAVPKGRTVIAASAFVTVSVRGRGIGSAGLKDHNLDGIQEGLPPQIAAQKNEESKAAVLLCSGRALYLVKPESGLSHLLCAFASFAVNSCFTIRLDHCLSA